MSRADVPFCDMRAAYNADRDDVDAAVSAVLAGGFYILGKEVEAFENDFAAICGARFGIGVATGTDAISLALMAHGIGAGDAVIAPSQTAVATVAAIENAGATPIFADIESDSKTQSPASLQAAIERFGAQHQIRGVVPVHLYGHPCNMAAINDIANINNLVVIEDCAQAHGAKHHGHMVGSLANAAAFSFYPTKNLAAVGDGGMVLTDDPAVATRLRALRQYGWQERYISSTAGINSRLDELQAAVLRVRLRTLNDNNNTRRRIAARYNGAFDKLDIALPQIAPDCQHVYHQYVIESARRDSLRTHLTAAGVASALLYPAAVHQQPAYEDRPRCELPVTKRLTSQLLCLPCHPWLSEAQQDIVIEAVRSFFI